MKISIRRGVAVALLIPGVVLALAVPVGAEPIRPGGGSHLDIAKGAALPNGSVAPAAVACVSTFTPVPQYSSSGGTYGTVHWGGHLTCSGTPGSGHFAEYLYTVEGTGDNQQYVLEDENVWNGVTGSDGTSWYTACYKKTSTRWIVSLFATYDDLEYTPYPVWSHVYTLTCGADL
jgi:hypothetical protein